MKEQEQKELDLLNGRGFEQTIRILGRNFTFRSKPLTLGRHLAMADVFIKMEIDEKALESEDLREQLGAQYNAVSKNTHRAVQVIAIALTDNKLLRWVIRRSLLRTMKPNELLDFVAKLLKTSDYANFIHSIALMNGNRPTKAQTMEG